MKLSQKSRVILEAIAEGHSFEQILFGNQELSYNDIFRAVAEALECIEQPEQDKTHSLEGIRRKFPRAYEKWSLDDDARLAGFFRAKRKINDIAKVFQRLRK